MPVQIQYNQLRKTDDAQQLEPIKLSNNVRMFPNCPINRRLNVYHGDQLQSDGVRGSLAIKYFAYKDRYYEKAKSLMDLPPHANVLSIVDVDVCKISAMKFMYIAMELFEEETLFAFLRDMKVSSSIFSPTNPIKYNEAVIMIAMQLVNALNFLHEHDIVHSDIAPFNILYSRKEGVVKLKGFGLNKDLYHGCARYRRDYTVDEDGYRAPETYNNDATNKESDVFSLGLIFHCMFSGGHHPCGTDPSLWIHRIKCNQNFQVTDLTIPRRRLAKDLLEKMLDFSPDTRLTMQQIAKHRFFEQEKKKHLKKDLILMFDNNQSVIFPYSTNLGRFLNREQNEKLSLEPEMSKNSFTAVEMDNDVYLLLHNKKVYVCKKWGKWERLADMKNDHGPRPPAVSYQGFIYVFGGGDSTFFSTGGSNVIERFDGHQWVTLGPVPEPDRQSFALLELDDEIYFIGGQSKKTKQSLETVFKLWSQEEGELSASSSVASMGQARPAPTAAVLQNQIYTTGRTTIESIEIYDPASNIWTLTKVSFSPLHHEYYLKIVTSLEKIYGIQWTENEKNFRFVVLNQEEAEWEVIEEIENTRLESWATIVVSDTLFQVSPTYGVWHR